MIARELQREQTSGMVYLIGAGPGDPELITVRGLKMLRAADVVVHDRLIAHELLAEARRDAEVIDVGKYPGRPRRTQAQINRLIVEQAQGGAMVARLKGGDPFVFGRGFEEVLACRKAQVDAYVIPGVSSFSAAPAAAGIPLTHRGLVRSFAVVTARVARDASPSALDYDALARMDAVVVMMGRTSIGVVADGLIRAGRPASTPAVCVENATTPRQRVITGTLETIAEAVAKAGVNAPVITIIGPTAALATELGQSIAPIENIDTSSVSEAV
ncbi:MAG: uroporphyrinogen-III C-methyltransferase [Planctomycetes bacterium]|nr:uroporphyrinogen-III C-methyltransferase [Planctomycetota bacterium]